ncbi:hypothetical protein UFOVP1615_33 [uncultured Caudovirales phage]|uniref:Uncharacterized protein n=1 Tax=uncultured Caudovirales phage TaxID=2100421 RepID=A0A6J5SWC8_9CAUD|nr:hypothetical protein UFOVP1615_33 [uncultured Caudovirales phage]
MAITTRYAVNMAMQYNEVTLNDFLINPSVGSRRFLTEAEQTRILRATETSALYFLTDVTGAGRSARYRWYDSGGTLLNEYLLGLTSAGVHNSIPIDWTSFYVPSGATKLTVAIIGSANGFANGDFALGSGNTFTSWTLAQPSRTNLVLRSQEFDNAYWTKGSSTITANSIVAPDGTLTADTLNETAVVDYHGFYRLNILSTNTFSSSIYAKKKDRDYFFMVLNNGASDFLTIFNLNNGSVASNAGGNTTFVETLPNGWFRFVISRAITDVGVDNIFYGVSNSPTNPAYLGDVTKGVYIWGAQLEQSLQATPYIPTTNATVTTSLGEFLQDATGGEDGSRCVKMWANSADTTYLRQAVNIVSGSAYTLRYRAKLSDAATTGVVSVQVNGGGWNAPEGVLSTEWQWLSYDFTGAATSSQNIDFKYANDANYGFAMLDDVSVSLTTPSELSEVRTYLLDDECVKYEYQLNWLNKLGGRDTWVFTGFPTITKDVTRDGQLEYSRRTNFVAPKRIYGSRAIASRESVTLSHQCKDRATAEWLKSELIDSIDILVKVGSSYYPADIVGSSIVVSNTFSQDFTIRFTIRYAFDVNVQTR